MHSTVIAAKKQMLHNLLILNCTYMQLWVVLHLEKGGSVQTEHFPGH